MATTLHFTKGQGTGNDFVLFADPDGLARPAPPRRSPSICDRHFGVGADGVIRAVRSAHLPEGAEAARRGRRRRVVHGLLQRRRLGRRDVRQRHPRLRALPDRDRPRRAGRRRHARRSAPAPASATCSATLTGFQVDLGRWSLDGGEPLVRAKELPVARPGLGIDVGNPHVVVALADEAELDAADLTLHPAPRAGAGGRRERRVRRAARAAGRATASAASACACTSAAAARRSPAAPARPPRRSRSGTGPGAARPNQWRVEVPGGTRRRADVPDRGRRARRPLRAGRTRLHGHPRTRLSAGGRTGAIRRGFSPAARRARSTR